MRVHLRRTAAGALALALTAGFLCVEATPAAAAGVDALQVVAVSPAQDAVEAVVALPDRLTGQTVPPEAFTVDGGHGKAAAISAVALAPDRGALAVVLDTSSAMAPSDLLAAQGAAVELVRALEPGTPVAVVATAGPPIVQAPTADASAVLSAIGSAHVGGDGTLQDGVATAVGLLGAGAVDPALALFTAGEGGLKATALAARVGEAGGLLTTFDATGATASDLIPAVEQLAGSLTGRYQLTLPAWGAGPATLELDFGGRTYQAALDLPASAEGPPASLAPPATSASPPVAETRPPESSVPAPTASTASTTSTSASSGASGRAALLAAVGAGLLAAVAVALVIVRRRSHTRARAEEHTPDPMEQPRRPPGPADAPGEAPVAVATSTTVGSGSPRPALTWLPPGTAPTTASPARVPPPPAALPLSAPAPMAAPAAPRTWRDLPAIDDLLAWSGRGVSAGRTWVVSPSQAALRERWSRLVSAPAADKARLLGAGRGGRAIDAVAAEGLPGHPASGRPLRSETRSAPVAIRYAAQELRPAVVDPRPPRDRPAQHCTVDHALSARPAVPDLDRPSAGGWRPGADGHLCATAVQPLQRLARTAVAAVVGRVRN